MIKFDIAYMDRWILFFLFLVSYLEKDFALFTISKAVRQILGVKIGYIS